MITGNKAIQGWRAQTTGMGAEVLSDTRRKESGWMNHSRRPITLEGLIERQLAFIFCNAAMGKSSEIKWTTARVSDTDRQNVCGGVGIANRYPSSTVGTGIGRTFELQRLCQADGSANQFHFEILRKLRGVYPLMKTYYIQGTDSVQH